MVCRIGSCCRAIAERIAQPTRCLESTEQPIKTALVACICRQIRVNIFQKSGDCVTVYLSIHYKTYCFAFQKRLFCNVKPTLLPCKTAAFAMPNRNYHFLVEISLQAEGVFPSLFLWHVVLPAEFQDLPKRFP